MPLLAATFYKKKLLPQPLWLISFPLAGFSKRRNEIRFKGFFLPRLPLRL
jgi:hypothetical protein